jgi:DNA-binding transcriptional MerR regulator
MEPEPDEALGIAELAERADVTPRTVRYYVSEGLLPPPGGAGQQRVYNTGHLLRLKAIKRLKDLFLPLGEIRRRLAELSPADLEALAEAPPEPAPESALDYITAALSVSQPQREPPVSPNPTPVAPAPQAPWPAGRARQAAVSGALPTPTPPAAGAAPGSTWQRVTLAPGVELHYQPTGDPARDAAIARLITEGATLLSTLPPAPGTPDDGPGPARRVDR